jgi:hypothetical protein
MPRALEGDRREEADHQDARGQEHGLGHGRAERLEDLGGEVAAAGLAGLEVQALGEEAGVHQHRDRR